jgi:hypothetical protein
VSGYWLGRVRSPGDRSESRTRAGDRRLEREPHTAAKSHGLPEATILMAQGRDPRGRRLADRLLPSVHGGPGGWGRRAGTPAAGPAGRPAAGPGGRAPDGQRLRAARGPGTQEGDPFERRQ